MDTKDEGAMAMEKRVKGIWFNTKKQINGGAIVSGIGFLLYLVGSALGWPVDLVDILLIAFAVVALWTFVSLMVYPEERRKAELTYSIWWGQGALTVLLVACAVLTIRQRLSGG